MSRAFAVAFLLLVVATGWPVAQAPEPPLHDTRLTVHTLVREDIFAGMLRGDLQRLARAERSLDTVLASLPRARAGGQPRPAMFGI